MKVLYFLNDDDKYGAGKSTMKLIGILREHHGIIPILITPKYNQNNKWCDENGVENYSIFFIDESIGLNTSKIKKIIKYTAALFFNKRLVRKLNKNIHFSEIDLIHTCFSGIVIGESISNKFNVPHVWHLRDFPITWKFFNNNQISMLNNSKTEFIAISDAVKTKWIENGLHHEKITRVYNGIDFSDVKYQKGSEEDSYIRIVFAGAVVEHKRPDILLNAIALLPEKAKSKLKVDIYGTTYPKYQNKLEEIIKINSLDEIVTFKGYYSNVNQILTNYDIGIMSSESEPFGRVTIEYMLAGLCVIASNSGANPELIQNGKNGYLFDKGDAQHMADTIEYLVENNEMIKKIGKYSRSYAVTHFSAKSNADQIMRKYKRMIKE